MLPLLVLSPHASGHIPADGLRQMLGEKMFSDKLRAQHLEHLFNEGDPFTDLIFQVPDAYFVPALTSRFVVDVNRYRDDDSQNGVIKVVDFDKQPLYPKTFKLSAFEREERLSRYYDSFHTEVKRVLARHKVKLLIDGHSMTAYGPSLSGDKGKVRPALTLMTGGDSNGEAKANQRLSLAPEKARAIKQLAEVHFASIFKDAPIPPVVALNDPWDIDEISDMYAVAMGVPAFGLEINRALYLDNDHKPLADKLRQLNRVFTAFAKAALKLF